MIERVATIIGSTGLIGSHLTSLLQNNDHFQTVRLIVRRPVNKGHKKTEVKLVDFEDHESFKLSIEGSHSVFCAVGTTQQKVKGDKNAYRKVDYDIPVKAAQFCKETGCRNFLLVSSVGANVNSSNFYLKLKGETEEAIKQKAVPNTHILRPSMLLGDRIENRPGERIGQTLMQTFSFAMLGGLKKYKPVQAKDVAAAMVYCSINETSGFNVYEYEEILKFANIK